MVAEFEAKLSARFPEWTNVFPHDCPIPETLEDLKAYVAAGCPASSYDFVVDLPGALARSTADARQTLVHRQARFGDLKAASACRGAIAFAEALANACRLDLPEAEYRRRMIAW